MWSLVQFPPKHMKANQKQNLQKLSNEQKQAIKDAFGDHLLERLDDIQLSEISGGVKLYAMPMFN